MLIDVSVTISNDMIVWPGDPPPCLQQVSTVETDGVALTAIAMGSHAGTHVDAPAHFLEGGGTVDRLPLESLVGPCRVLDVRNAEGAVGRIHLEPHSPLAGERLLLKTRNEDLLRTGKFRVDFVGLAEDGALFLVQRGVRLIGIDFLSIEPFGSQTFPVHKTLLRAGVVILEGIDLVDVAPGTYRLFALPLKLEGADGAPARVLLESCDPE